MYQATKHVEILQTQYIGEDATISVVMQRQVLRPSPNQVTTHVEISHTQYINKVVAVLVATQRQVSPSLNQVTNHVETPQTQFFDQGVAVPIVIQRQAPQIQTVLKTVEALPVLFLPVVMQPQAPQILTVVKTVYVPPLLFIGRFVDLTKSACGASSKTRAAIPSRCHSPMVLRGCWLG